MIIDHHNHIWAGDATGDTFLDAPLTVEAILEAMDVAGVEMAGVCTVAQDMQNDYVLESQNKHSDRIFGYCMVNPRDKDAVETLRHYLGEGLKGLKLHPRFHGYSLANHTLVDPLLDVCREHKVPVFSHGAGGEEFNSPFHFEELARHFPDLPLIIGHMGSINELEAAYLVAGRNEHIYLDTSLCSLDGLKGALRQVGPDKIMMSTDWPGNDFRLELYKVELATLDDEDTRRKLTGENYTRMVDALQARRT